MATLNELREEVFAARISTAQITGVRQGDAEVEVPTMPLGQAILFMVSPAAGQVTTHALVHYQVEGRLDYTDCSDLAAHYGDRLTSA
jgi:hypothetical protein